MAGKFALIIGNNEYLDATLSRLKTPEADVRALAAALRDPAIGGFDHVQEVINQDESSIRRDISAFFTDKKPDDLLMLYFSGHGVLDPQGRLFLAVKDTRRTLLKATAIPASFVSDNMDDCRSKRQILVLDCCHSGAFERGTKGNAPAITQSTFAGSGYGRAVLTASDSTQYALEGDQVIEQVSLSLFTHYLLDGLTTGEADTGQDGWITLDEWYDYVYDRVRSVTPQQTPRKWVYNQQGDLIIAKNPRLSEGKSTLFSATLRAHLKSAYMPDRLEAIFDLESLLKERDPALTLAAREILKHLATEDDSLIVRSRANALLEESTSSNWEDWVKSQEPDQVKTGEDKLNLEPAMLKGTIALETLGGVATPILLKGETLPVVTSQVFSTATDNQSQIEVHLLMGDRAMAADNHSLGKFTLDSIPPAPMGIPRIEVSIAVGADQVLQVTATDKATLRSQSLGNVDLKTIQAPAEKETLKTKRVTSEELSDLLDGSDFPDIFESIFRPEVKRQPQNGADLNYPLNLTFEEAVEGAERLIEFTRDVLCTACNGSGAKPGTPTVKCKACGGRGERRRKINSVLGDMVQVQTCEACHGRGNIIQAPCEHCGGKGVINHKHKKAVYIPAGIYTGMKVRLAGEGQPGLAGGRYGSLYLDITVGDHPLFRRQGDDLHLEYLLTRDQLTKGGTFKIPTLTKKKPVQLKIPPGSAENSTFTIQGQGVPRYRGEGKGSLLVVLKVYDPRVVSKELEQKLALIREYAGK